MERRLFIDESYLIPDFEIRYPLGVNFKDVFCGTLREVSKMPGFGVEGVNDGVIRVDPDDRQVCEDGQHVNGCVQAALPSLDEEQALVRRETMAKGQSAQATEETFAIANR